MFSWISQLQFKWTSPYYGHFPGLNFLTRLNLAVNTMNNRTCFHWWLERGIPKIKGYNRLLQKYPCSLCIKCEFDRFPWCPVFPAHTFLWCSGSCRQFSQGDSLSGSHSLRLCLCQLKQAPGCACDIFSEVHCIRDVDCPLPCFPVVFFPHFFPVLSFLSFEVRVLDIFFFLKRSFIHLGYCNKYLHQGRKFKITDVEWFVLEAFPKADATPPQTFLCHLFCAKFHIQGTMLFPFS